VLFSEGSSLTAREFVSVLGPDGHHIEVLDPNPACICRFSCKLQESDSPRSRRESVKRFFWDMELSVTSQFREVSHLTHRAMAVRQGVIEKAEDRKSSSP
jgi:hypothetical protein